MSEARKLLEELERKSEARRMLEEAESGAAPNEVKRGIIDVLADNISRPFNRGLANVGMMLPGGDSLKADLTNMGMISPDDQQAEGVIPRAMEIAGGSVLPGMGLMRQGQIAMQAAPQVLPALRGALGYAPAPQGIVSEAGKAVAQAPWASVVGDIMASLGGGIGGEVAESYGAPESVQALGELAGGMGVAGAAAAAPVAGRAVGTMAGKAADVAEKLPLTGPLVRIGRDIVEGTKTMNPYYRASKEVQSRVRDPEVAAARITDPDMPSARQIDENRMLQLEQTVRRRGPTEEEDAIDQHIANTVAARKEEAIDFGGNTEAARRAVEQRSANQVARVKERADRAMEEADRAIAQVDSGASPRDISRVERERLETALNEARKEESRIWGEIDQDAPAQAVNTRQAYDDLKAAESEVTFGRNVPEDIDTLLARADEGVLTLKDLQSIRSELNDQIRSLRADGQWNKARILGKFQESLLDDMAEVDSAGIDAARSFSKQLNEKFTQGEVGRILKYEESGVRAVDAPETLSALFSGKNVSRGIRQFLEASPESKDSLAEFVGNRYILQVVKPDGSVNPGQAKRAIDTLRKQGVFEEFPELEGQLQNAVTSSQKAANLAKRSQIVKQRGGARLERGSNESLASSYLKGEVGKEAGTLLKAKNPTQVARKLRSAMRGDENAEEGLRQSFANALWDSAKGPLDEKSALPTYKPAEFRAMVAKHIETMRALGFSEDHIQLIKQFGTTLRQATAKAEGQAREELMTDIPGKIINKLSRVLGARAANWLHSLTGGTGAGPGLQTAQIGASSAQEVASGLRVDPAEMILRDAMNDPSLMKALLLRDNASPAAKKQAVERLNLWAAGVGIKGIADMDEDESP